MPFIEGIYYFASGVGGANKKRPPVILLHGAGGNHLSWPPQIRRMDGETIYALDLPGHGKSEGIGRQSIDEYVNDVLLFMKGMEIPAAVLIGISMGSAVALQLARRFPRKVIGLGLLGAGARLRVAPLILETAGNANSFESAVDMINENCFGRLAPKNLVQLSKRYMMEMRPPVLLGDFLACNGFDETTHLGGVRAPTLIISGAGDRMTPVRLAETLRDEIVHSQLHVMADSGHMVMLEQPEAVVKLLKDFLDSLPLKAPRTAKTRIAPAT